jgi:hypothetical protein
MSNDDTYDGMAARIEAAADDLTREADNAAEVLAERGWGDADPQQWADRKRAAATAARQYAAELRAVDHGPQARLTAERLAQAEQVANAAELGGILIDGRPVAERTAEGAAWEAGTHPAQEKAREIEATGAFTYVAETIDGVEQVPFWQLGGPVDQSPAQRTDRQVDEDEA